jgi:hypothetical protein
LSLWCTGVEPHHVGQHATFIDEHQPLGVKGGDLSLKGDTLGLNVRLIPLGGVQGLSFFDASPTVAMPDTSLRGLKYDQCAR